jgi:hypothetical protein
MCSFLSETFPRIKLGVAIIFPCMFVLAVKIHSFNEFVCLIYRHYLMVNTRVVCIGQWWTGTRKGGPWCSLCAQERTKWWNPHKSWFAERVQGSTRISHGQNYWSLPKSTTGLMLLPSKASSNGFYLPNHPTLLPSSIVSPWALLAHHILSPFV